MSNVEKRFIEVKGRAQSGAIILTGPEVDKLRQQVKLEAIPGFWLTFP